MYTRRVPRESLARSSLVSDWRRSFPKGPLYLLTTSLALELLSSAWLARHLNATLESAANERQGERIIPWEDVYTGLALARVVRAQGGASSTFTPDLAIVDAQPVVSDSYGVMVKPSTIVWHMHHTYQPSRIAFVHDWLEVHKRACAAEMLAGAVHCRPNATECGRHHGVCVTQSCARATWLFCVHRPRSSSNCSRAPAVDLKRVERDPAGTTSTVAVG